MIGPDYVCCSETPGVDNDSIMKTPERLRGALRALAAADPPIEAAFLLGDVMHAAYPFGDDFEAYLNRPSAFSVSRAILDEAPFPVHMLW